MRFFGFSIMAMNVSPRLGEQWATTEVFTTSAVPTVDVLLINDLPMSEAI